MRALTITAPNEVALIDKPIPHAGPGEVVVRTTASLVCTSDVHTAGGGLGSLPLGRTLGHESVGVVHEIGANVRTVELGRRVASSTLLPCGYCANCQGGADGHCGGRFLGAKKFTSTRDGSLAEYFVVENADYNLAPIPDDLPDDVAVYATDMMSTAFSAAESGSIPMGGTAAVFAQGAVGLCATAASRLLGAGLIIAIESVPQRADLARQFGADVVLDPGSDVVAQIMDLTDGVGVDVAIEALGASATFTNCVRAARFGGTIVNAGYHADPSGVLGIPLADWGLGMGGKTIKSVLCPPGSARLTRMMRLLRNGRFDPTPLTTHRLTIAEAETAFRLMATKQDGVIKTLVTYGDLN